MANARAVVTDSGGVQEETTALGVPCLTLRKNTERPITISEGTNRLIGTSAQEFQQALIAIESRRGQIPALWEGHAGERIAADLARS